MNKICVYTCITGNYDDLQEIEEKEAGIDYYCFTNNDNIKSNTWKIIKIQDESLSNLTLARKTKILGTDIVNKYEIALWMDASVRFNKPIKDFINTYFSKKDVFTAFKHGQRNNIKDECFECVRMRKETKERVKRLLSFYEKENYKYDNGLIESTIFIKRPNDKKVIETMKMWYSMLKKYSNRDQLSFNYCLSKTHLPVHWINLKVFNNKWVSHTIHNSKSTMKDCRIYFDDSSNIDHKYSLDLEELCPYLIKDSIYSIRVKIPADTNVIEIEVTDIPCIMYSNFETNLSCDKVIFFNTIPYKNDNLFYNAKGIIRLEGNFKKGDGFRFSINLNQLSPVEQFSLIDNLSNDLIILSEENDKVKNELRKTEDELLSIKSSISYKFYVREIRYKNRYRHLKNKLKQ